MPRSGKATEPTGDVRDRRLRYLPRAGLSSCIKATEKIS